MRQTAHGGAGLSAHLRLGPVLLALALAGAAPAQAAAPVIDSIRLSSPTVQPGGVVTATVEAHDPDCVSGICTSGCGAYIRADLTTWNSAAGAFLSVDPGTSASPYSTRADWQAPLVEGLYTLQVTVSDSGTFLCGGRASVSANIPVQVTASANQPPAVNSVTAQPAQLHPGQPAALACEASDPDGDPISYGWSADMGVVTGAGATATFVGSAPGIATITCAATDPSGGTGIGTVQVSVTDALAEFNLASNLFAPVRLAADSLGSLYVVDSGSGGITVLNFFSRELVYRLPLPEVASVAVDWGDRLLVGAAAGARLLGRAGGLILALDPGEALGPATDVSVDLVNRRYGVLYGDAARVVLFDSAGARLAAFGTIGSGPADLKRPVGLAFLPDGRVVVGDNGLSLVKVFDATGALSVSFGGPGGGAGKFVQLAAVAADARGVIYVSDAFQGWVQCFDPDGTLREVLGSFGAGVGRLQTPVGIAAPAPLSRLLVASVNSSSLQVFRTIGPDPVPRLPQPTLAPGALTFPSQAVGTTSDWQVVTLGNIGEAPLGIRSLSVTGDFLETHDCGRLVDPGQQCQILVRFNPSTPGPSTGELVIDTSAADGRLRLSLAGEGFLPPSIALSPPQLAFGNQVVATSSAPRSVLLTNTGGSLLSIAGIRTSGPFGFASGCPALVPAGQVCSIDVTFTPQDLGPADGTLVVDSNAEAGNSVVGLGGVGIAPSLSLVPAALEFGWQTVGRRSKVQRLTLTNLGDGKLAIGAVALEGSGAASFVITADQCGGRPLAPAESCRLRVAFEPLSEGELRARLRVDSNAPEGAVFADLSGTGEDGQWELIFRSDLEPGDLSEWTLVENPPQSAVRVGQGGMAPLRLKVSLGAQAAGAEPALRTLAVVNDGAAPLKVDPIALSGDLAGGFQLREDLCSGWVLAPGDACTVSVAFAPTAPRPASAELWVSFGGATGPAVFVLGAGGTPGEKQP